MSTGRLPLILAKSGLPVELIGPVDERASVSAHLWRHTVTKQDFASFADALAERLRASPPSMVIWGDDRTIEAAQHHPHSEFDAWWPANLSLYPKRTISYKADFQRWAMDRNLPVARGKVVENLEQAIELVEEWKCEVIVKPSRGSGGMGIFRASSADEMRSRWLDKVKGPWAVQEFLVGRNCILQYAARNGKLLMAVSGSRVSTNGNFGYSIRRVYWENPRATELMRQFVEATGFTGLGGGDAIELSDGSIKVVELTLRPTPGLHLLDREGVPMDQVIRQVVGLDEVSSVPWTQVRGGRVWPLFPESLVSTLDRNLPGQTLANLLHPNLWRGMTWDDPALIRQGFVMTYQAFNSVFTRGWRAARRLITGKKNSPRH